MRHLILIMLCLCSQVFAYQVTFEGNLPEEILSTAANISQLESDKNRPPPTLFTLKKRAESDKKALIEVLHAFGYYEGDISISYLGAFPNTTVRIYFEPGPVYTFGSLTILDEHGMPIYLAESAFSIKIGCPACSDKVLDTQDQILEQIACMGYPLAKILDREVVVDQFTKLVSVTYIVHRGDIAYFGPIQIEGLCKVREAVIKRRIAWARAELYNPNKVACTDAYLQESGLFSLVSVRPAETIDENGYIPMLVDVKEKKYRHIGAGISYSTDESVGVMAQWSHDNLLGWGDALSLNGEYSEIIKRATLLYGMPDFFGKNQDLLYSAEARHEDTPGFIEKELSFLIRINKKINDCFSFNYGSRYEWLLSTKSDNNCNYNLLSFPVQLRWDTSNRLLNPTSGTTIAYFFTPYKAFFNEHVSFLKQELFMQTYQPIFGSEMFLLALSGQLGSIVGASRYEIPAPKRFYAGSSTSLRGYKYLTVSPIVDDKPIGGRSIIIGSIEPRVRVYDKLYLATFYDVGNVYSSSFPRLNKKVLNSVGVGLRYLTPVGPFRLDIGFPLNRRKHIDKRFQIYASLGPTF